MSNPDPMLEKIRCYDAIAQLSPAELTALVDAPTLRDRFAMAALPLMTADCDLAHAGSNGCDAEAHAKAAYRIADAMLKAREVRA